MDMQELLEELKAEARQIADAHPDELERLGAASDRGYAASAVAKYDYQAFVKLLSLSQTVPVSPVDEAALADFRGRVDRYMDACAPGDRGFKEYIRVVSIYLAFVARMPLHPPGMRFSGDKAITFTGGVWRCPGKRKYARDPASLCKYCVCRSD